MTQGILVFSETGVGAFELLTKGRELSRMLNYELSVVAFAKKDADMSSYFEHGAQKVLIVPNEGCEALDPENCAHVLVEVAKENGPDIVLIRSTRLGKEVAGRVAQKLEAGCITDAIGVTVRGLDLVADRYALGGNTISTETVKSKKKVISIMPGAFEAQPAPVQGKSEILDISFPPRRTEVVERKNKIGDSVNIEVA